MRSLSRNFGQVCVRDIAWRRQQIFRLDIMSEEMINQSKEMNITMAERYTYRKQY